MIRISESRNALRKQMNDSFDFVVLCCHAVPALKRYMKAVETGSATKIPDPDYFKTIERFDRLKEVAPNYKKVLGKFLVLSSFSYFESYVSNVIRELFAFHGGKDKFLELSKKQRDSYISFNQAIEDQLAEDIKKNPADILRQYNNPETGKGKEKVDKYRKAINTLNFQGYKFPSNLFSALAIFNITDKANKFVAHEIPKLLEYGFGVDITEDEKTEFDKWRNLRNDVAHGKCEAFDLSEAIKMNRFFRELAKKVDKHLLKNFFVIESTDNYPLKRT